MSQKVSSFSRGCRVRACQPQEGVAGKAWSFPWGLPRKITLLTPIHKHKDNHNMWSSLNICYWSTKSHAVIPHMQIPQVLESIHRQKEPLHVILF